jgi:hypothetical protein
MSHTKSFSPETINRMTAVYNRAVQELKLERAPTHERDRLAVYILPIGNTLHDPNRMLDRAVRMYHRTAKLDGLPFTTANASSAFEPEL